MLIDREEMNNLYKGPFIDASYQVSVHLAKTVSEEKNIKNQPIRNKNRLYKGLPIDDTYQVLVHLVKRFIEDSLEINQSETRIVCGGNVC